MSSHVATSMAAFQLELHGNRPTESGCCRLASLNVKMQLRFIFTKPEAPSYQPFVDDPAIWSKTKDDEAWFHDELDKRFDVKHHSYLTVETPLTYCGARISCSFLAMMVFSLSTKTQSQIDLFLSHARALLSAVRGLVMNSVAGEVSCHREGKWARLP